MASIIKSNNGYLSCKLKLLNLSAGSSGPHMLFFHINYGGKIEHMADATNIAIENIVNIIIALKEYNLFTLGFGSDLYHSWSIC